MTATLKGVCSEPEPVFEAKPVDEVAPEAAGDSLGGGGNHGADSVYYFCSARSHTVGPR